MENRTQCESTSAKQLCLEVGRNEIQEESISRLMDDMYGLHVTSVDKQVGYYGHNFRLSVRDKWENPRISHLHRTGYLLKINDFNETFTAHADAEISIQARLRDNGIQCPQPVMCKQGRLMSIITASQDEVHTKLLLRLQTFIPGAILDCVPYTPAVIYDAGAYLAKVHNALEGFSQDILLQYNVDWCLKNLPDLDDFLMYVKGENRPDLIRSVLREFQDDVVPNFHHFQTGIIHGDFSVHNILVKANLNGSTSAPVEHKVHGILDFEHSAHCFYVFDVAIACAYISLCSRDIDPLQAPGHFLAGYLSIRALNEWEQDVLKACIEARFAQSLVFGEYNYHLNPRNEYVLTTAKTGWTKLEKLLAIPKRELYEIWREVKRYHAERKDAD